MSSTACLSSRQQDTLDRSVRRSFGQPGGLPVQMQLSRLCGHTVDNNDSDDETVRTSNIGVSDAINENATGRKLVGRYPVAYFGGFSRKYSFDFSPKSELNELSVCISNPIIALASREQ